MDTLLLTRLLAVAALVFAVAAFARKFNWMLSHSFTAIDRAAAKGEAWRGLLYAFTLGMMPWAKESTRRHFIAYLRGIAFHLGIFAGLLAFFVSPWWSLAPAPLLWLFGVVTALGAVFGFAGDILRRVERNLTQISTPDDHASVLLVSLFLTAVAAALFNFAFMPVMYLVGALMLFYMPLGKIRHCIYFFFSRRFFGLFVGRRDVIHHAEAVK